MHEIPPWLHSHCDLYPNHQTLVHTLMDATMRCRWDGRLTNYVRYHWT